MRFVLDMTTSHTKADRFHIYRQFPYIQKGSKNTNRFHTYREVPHIETGSKHNNQFPHLQINSTHTSMFQTHIQVPHIPTGSMHTNRFPKISFYPYRQISHIQICSKHIYKFPFTDRFHIHVQYTQPGSICTSTNRFQTYNVSTHTDRFHTYTQVPKIHTGSALTDTFRIQTGSTHTYRYYTQRQVPHTQVGSTHSKRFHTHVAQHPHFITLLQVKIPQKCTAVCVKHTARCGRGFAIGRKCPSRLRMSKIVQYIYIQHKHFSSFPPCNFTLLRR